MAGRRCGGYYHKLGIQDGKFMKIELNCGSFEEMPEGERGRREGRRTGWRKEKEGHGMGEEE